MKAIKFQNQAILMVDAPMPEISGHEALIKVLMAGICATDIELFHGYQNFHGIPGHEFVGIVEAAPQAPELIGKRVAVDINVGCGQCSGCRAGDARHCPLRKVIGIRGRDGGFAVGLWRQKDKQWKIQSLHVLPDGRKASSVNLLTQVDENTFTWESTGRDVDGEILPNLGPVTVKRAGADR